jgi:hypothetical protein
LQERADALLATVDIFKLNDAGHHAAPPRTKSPRRHITLSALSA